MSLNQFLPMPIHVKMQQYAFLWKSNTLQFFKINLHSFFLAMHISFTQRCELRLYKLNYHGWVGSFVWISREKNFLEVPFMNKMNRNRDDRKPTEQTFADMSYSKYR